MALDHGVINVPLNKRGNFHKELESHLAKEANEKRHTRYAAIAKKSSNREIAMDFFKTIDTGLLKALAAKKGIKPSKLKKIIRETCSDHPLRAIKIMECLIVKVQ